MAVQLPISDAQYSKQVHKLSEASVHKHWEAYVDISWDDPDLQVSVDDPRWRLVAEDPLASHPWYLAQSQERQTRIAMTRIASNMRVGVQFENLLSRALLILAVKEPNGADTFRYAYHEVIEEGHHTLMFQELINRTGLPIKGASRLNWHFMRLGQGLVTHIRPEALFFGVLGGEEPIDYIQRKALRHPQTVHPLLERIFRIHVSEEARHVSFAQTYLRHRVRRLNRLRRWWLAFTTPLITAYLAHLMLDPTKDLENRCGVPHDVLNEAYYKNPAWQAELAESVRKIRDLAVELGIVGPFTRRIWKRLRIWAPAPGRA
jgi:ribosomal protein S18 acetylase RimI-like enzyme